jgi:hypothetical protein
MNWNLGFDLVDLLSQAKFVSQRVLCIEGMWQTCPDIRDDLEGESA